MPRSQREICDQICSAYFERRSATARALNERGGDDNVRKHLLPCGFDLLKADERDTRILEWYQDDGAPLQTLLLTARRIAIVWMIEFFAEKEPFFLPKLLEFDLHYLHVLQFSRLLADAVPRKLDPLLSSSCGDDLNVRRKNFVKEIGGVWKAVRRSAVKIPAPPDLLQKLHDTIECLKQEPPERKLSDILPPAGRRAMSYNDPELESEEQQELEKDVERARVGSVAYPYKFSETLVNLRKRERPNSEPKIEDEPLERLVWDIKKIRDFVQGGRYIDAATLILSYRYRASEGTVRADSVSGASAGSASDRRGDSGTD